MDILSLLNNAFDFHNHIDLHNITPYSEVYGCNIQTHASYGAIGSFHLRPLPVGHDAFTGLSQQELRLRQQEVSPNASARLQILNHVLLDGAAWETPTFQLVSKVSVKQNFQKKRVGVRQANTK